MTARCAAAWLAGASIVAWGCSSKPAEDAVSQAPQDPVQQAEPTGQPEEPPPPTSFPEEAPLTAPADPLAPHEAPDLPPRTLQPAPDEPSARIEPSRPEAPRDALPGAEPYSHQPPAGFSPPDEAASKALPEDGYHVVEVFYGTDRARLDLPSPGWSDHLLAYRAALGVLAATLAGAGLLLWRRRRRAALAAGIFGACLTLGLGLTATRHVLKTRSVTQKQLVQYGNGRGRLEVGVCRVSIPQDHRVGELESPSVLRLEFQERPERHVMLLEAKAYPPDEFYSHLQNTVAGSATRELLVFVHGYNVTFENAVRRTGQIAYDLQFPGPAVCYSWPSHGGLLRYTADEANVEWTVPHLKEFLTQLRQRSGATAINLVAHSMGTRALTDVLREFSRESQAQGAGFNQVVLAAPDIDAEVFQRDLAPALSRTARRVTLYASSNDQALIASRQVHGYPRAGESGENLVVTQGLDTIDVSAIDTSLLGHSYYGDNDSIISDLYHLIHRALPPSQRERLKQADRDGLPYWVFLATPPLPDAIEPP